jgi:hypothetical protein
MLSAVNNKQNKDIFVAACKLLAFYILQLIESYLNF